MLQLFDVEKINLLIIVTVRKVDFLGRKSKIYQRLVLLIIGIKV